MIFALLQLPETHQKNSGLLIVVGEETVFPGSKSREFDDITDGTAYTLMVVESNSSVHWMEPTDIQLSELEFSDGATVQIGGSHGNLANVLWCDGSIWSIALKDVERKMFTVADGE